MTWIFLHANTIVIRVPNLVAYRATLAGLQQYASAPWGIQNPAADDHTLLVDLLWKFRRGARSGSSHGNVG